MQMGVTKEPCLVGVLDCQEKESFECGVCLFLLMWVVVADKERVLGFNPKGGNKTKGDGKGADILL